MTGIIFDIEGDGLLDEIKNIHCFSYRPLDKDEIRTIYNYDDIRNLLKDCKVLIGHNIIRFDIPALEKILDIKIEAKLIDTLALSWYLNHSRIIHGLESYGEDYGIPKPIITDWHNLTREEYTHRCEEDVSINTHLWFDLRDKLLRLYGSKREADRLIDYLSFKMDCAREQERSGWKLDVEKAKKHLAELEKLQEEKITELIQVMPSRKLIAKRTKPAKPFKKDGTWSTHGAKWFNLLREHSLPNYYAGIVEVVVGEEPANPNSTDQVKDWLLSLGWKPETFKFVKDKETREERKIPQVRMDGEDGKELCHSVIKLANKEPSVRLLEGLSVIQHRLSIFKGFVESEKDGYLKAEIAGLTNTLRFKHKKPLVNLPGVSKAWGEEIRGCLIAPEGEVLCGSDMVSLEDTTKRHFMWDYDPDYVTEMSRPGFDPHLDLAKHAGVVTQQEIDDWVNKVVGAKNLKPLRTNYKRTNYSATYGIYKYKLARELDIPVREAADLLDSFWKRNWSILKIVEDLTTKNLDDEEWLLNPVSGFYYSLRSEKDKFSTLNQGTGVYCFDSWIMEWRKKRSQLTAQMHDEIVACLPEGKRQAFKTILQEAIGVVNEKLNLNIKLGIDVKFGKTYAEIH